MKIHAAEVSKANGRVRVRVRIELDRRHPERIAASVPDELWYEFPAEAEAMLYLGPEPFIAALLPFAMGIREPIQVSEPISAQFAYHLRRWQQLYQLWNRDYFQEVQIQAPGYHTAPPENQNQQVGMMFSGGVDSFETLLTNLPDENRPPGYGVTHAIFMFQFDLPEFARANYDRAVTSFAKLFTGLGIQFLPVDFNGRHFVPDASVCDGQTWQNRTHGAGLFGAGLLLSGGLRRLLVSASSYLFGPSLFGTNLISDHLLSTEWFEVIHHGFQFTRVDKTLLLAEQPLTYDYLRVCWWQPDGVQNCCRCPKCLRVMTTLEIAGRLGDYNTFSLPLNKRLLIKEGSASKEVPFTAENLVYAQKAGRWDLIPVLALTVFIGRIRLWLKTRMVRRGPQPYGPFRRKR
jgi:hypothetical protein